MMCNKPSSPADPSPHPPAGEKDVLSLLKRRALMILMGMDGMDEEEEGGAATGGGGAKKAAAAAAPSRSKSAVAAAAASEGSDMKRQKKGAQPAPKKEEEEEEEEGLGEDERELLDSEDSDKVSVGE